MRLTYRSVAVELRVQPCQTTELNSITRYRNHLHMPDGLGTIVFLVFLVLFIYLAWFDKESDATTPDLEHLSPKEQDRRDRAIAELEKRVESARRKKEAISADLDEDPAAAAKTLRRFMKKR